MALCLSVINQKGGVGKSTTIVQLAAILGREHRVLVVDLDGSHNSTSRLLASDERDRPGLYDLLIDEDGKLEVARAIYPAKPEFRGVYVLAGDKRLGSIEQHLSSRFARESILSRILQPLHDKFQFILLDNSPSLHVLALNSLCSATHYLVPVDMSLDAAHGALAVEQTISLMRKAGMQASPKCLGVLVCQAQKDNARATKEMRTKHEELFDSKLLAMRIQHTTKMAEANNSGLSIFQIDPKNAAAKAYEELAALIVSEAEKTMTATTARKKDGKRRPVSGRHDRFID